MTKASKKRCVFAAFVLLCVLAAGVSLGGMTARADESDRYVLDTSLAPTSSLAFAPVISNNMLYRQNKPVPVWGFAPAGTAVTVTLQRQDGTGETETKQATADESGCFETQFSPRAASFTEYKLSATDGETTVTAEYILFGELFIAGGQSNMGLNVQYCSNAQEIHDGANNPHIRVFLSPEVAGSAALPYYPSVYWEGGMWARGDNYVSIRSASAVAYNFALSMFAKLNAGGATVPVGILNAPKGATSIEAWISRPSVDGEDTVRAYLAERNRLLTEEEYNQKGASNYNQVSGLFNAKIAPLTKLYVNGILWYQGENNVGNETAGTYYRHALSLLMRDWSIWFNGGEDDLPLFFVHPTPARYRDYEPEALAYMWEGMTDAQQDYPDRISFATTYDVPLDWYNEDFPYRSPAHTLVKKPVGERLADFAYNRLYGGTGAQSSPVFASARYEGNAAIVSFKKVNGLKTTDGNVVRGFALCGENRVFYPAQAVINADNTVTVTSEWVKKPIAVTYSFSTMITASNLCSDEGYPVAPFRSDRVPSSYYSPKNWQSCDGLQFFVSKGSGRDPDFAYMSDAYASSASATLSIAQDGYYGGALQIDYTLRGRETFWIAPVLHQPAVHEYIERYDTFSFRVRNRQARKVDIERVEVTLADGRKGDLILCDGSGTAAEAAANSDFTPYRYSLTRMVSDGGTVDISSLRASITDIKIYCKDFLSGSIQIDEFAYGNIADLVTSSSGGNTGGDNKEDDPPVTPQKPKKKKCGCGSTVASSSAFAGGCVLLLAAAVAIGRKKKGARHDENK